MASPFPGTIAERIALSQRSGSANLIWAFVERQTNLWKRYWAWELVWLVYGVVNTLAITFIAKEAELAGLTVDASGLVLFLLLGTLVWAYLSAVLDDISLVITWERWEGTIEHTLMAPVPRSLHLIGMCVFGILHAIARTMLIFLIALPFFNVGLGQADWVSAVAVILVGSISVAGLGILTGASRLYPAHPDVVHAGDARWCPVSTTASTLPAAGLQLHLACYLHPDGIRATRW